MDLKKSLESENNHFAPTHVGMRTSANSANHLNPLDKKAKANVAEQTAFVTRTRTHAHTHTHTRTHTHAHTRTQTHTHTHTQCVVFNLTNPTHMTCLYSPVQSYNSQASLDHHICLGTATAHIHAFHRQEKERPKIAIMMHNNKSHFRGLVVAAL